MPTLNLRDLRRKIRSVENLKKITRAMQMVAASKLKKTQARLMQIRPYADKIAELLGEVSARAGDVSHPLLEARPEVRSIVLAVFSSDKGLCGTYNTNLIHHVEKVLQASGKPARIMAIGRKAGDSLARHGFTIFHQQGQLPPDIPFRLVQDLTGRLMKEFLEGRCDEVHVSFTRFVNPLVFRPETVRLLPAQIGGGKKKEGDVIYEPNPVAILDQLLPRYIETTFQRLLFESVSSEHAARMNAMRNATDNAQDLIQSLVLTRNKLRQASITKELLDIVGGAEAQRKAAG